MSGIFITVLGEISIISWSSDQMCKGKSACLCVGQMNESKEAIKRWEGQVEEFKMYPSYEELFGIDGEAIEFEWNIFPGISSLRILQEIQRDLKRASNLKNSQTGSSSCQCSTTSIGQRKEIMRFAYRMQKKWRITRWDSCKDTGRFWVLDRTRSGMENPRIFPMETGTPQQIKWYNDSKKPVIPRSKALVLGVVESWTGRKVKETIHFNGDSSNTELLFRISHSVNQLRQKGAVANWCEQFGSQRKERNEKIWDLWTKVFDKREVTRSTTFGIPSENGISK